MPYWLGATLAVVLGLGLGVAAMWPLGALVVRLPMVWHFGIVGPREATIVVCLGSLAHDLRVALVRRDAARRELTRTDRKNGIVFVVPLEETEREVRKAHRALDLAISAAYLAGAGHMVERWRWSDDGWRMTR